MNRLVFALAVLLATPALAQGDAPRDDAPLVPLAEVAPSVVQDVRYATAENFVGTRIDGYEAPSCWLTRPAAEALAAAQAEAEAFGLTLVVFDCYRPQRAVDHFVRWAAVPADTLMKARYYPAVPKDSLFAYGYIAARSGHSRGSTVDLTLADAATGQPLPMGTRYDFFDALAHTENSNVGTEARRNRLLLRALLDRHGFRNYTREWWHFTLRDEPFPDTFFDVPITSTPPR
ncbi:MAG: M15 family metallopeptidase [Bacteroidota bacterium]